MKRSRGLRRAARAENDFVRKPRGAWIAALLFLAGCSQANAPAIHRGDDTRTENASDKVVAPPPLDAPAAAIATAQPRAARIAELHESARKAKGEASSAAEMLLSPGADAMAGIIGLGAGTIAQSQGGSRLMQRSITHSMMGRAYQPAPEFNTEAYAHNADNVFRNVSDNPLSTFSVDVDTASYSNVRRFLRDGQRPPIDAVRIEELLNYFRYDYAQPRAGEPFAVSTEVADAPWKKGHRLVQIGLRARDIAQADVPARNLVFLIDVSGSMQTPDKLPLLKRGLAMLIRQLRPQDRMAMVVYAGASGLALPSTPGSDKDHMLAALESLEAGGSTNGADGIELAYSVAQAQFVRGGVNRVILATDGDFNVGVTSEGELTRLIEQKRKSGVFLTVLGFGTGNLKDATMEALADKGNGHYAYIDSIDEARKVLVRESGSTLMTLAKDVKLQIEWNPARVASYRLIGYENRVLQDRDFNDDAKDAGDIGAGHTVTALYEVVPKGDFAAPPPEVDALKYQGGRALSSAAGSAELMTVKLRYKRPDADKSQLLSQAVTDQGKNIEQASTDLRWAAAVVSFGMLLRHSAERGDASFGLVLQLARSALGGDTYGDRREMLDLVERAAAIIGNG